MSSFDITLSPIGFGLSPIENEDGKATDLHFVVTVGALLPFQVGPGQPPPVMPIGTVRIPLNKEVAENLATSLSTEAEKLVHRSKLDIAQTLNPEALAAVAEQEKKIRGE